MDGDLLKQFENELNLRAGKADPFTGSERMRKLLAGMTGNSLAPPQYQPQSAPDYRYAAAVQGSLSGPLDDLPLRRKAHYGGGRNTTLPSSAFKPNYESDIADSAIEDHPSFDSIKKYGTAMLPSSGQGVVAGLTQSSGSSGNPEQERIARINQLLKINKFREHTEAMAKGLRPQLGGEGGPRPISMEDDRRKRWLAENRGLPKNLDPITATMAADASPLNGGIPPLPDVTAGGLAGSIAGIDPDRLAYAKARAEKRSDSRKAGLTDTEYATLTDGLLAPGEPSIRTPLTPTGPRPGIDPAKMQAAVAQREATQQQRRRNHLANKTISPENKFAMMNPQVAMARLHYGAQAGQAASQQALAEKLAGINNASRERIAVLENPSRERLAPEEAAVWAGDGTSTEKWATIQEIRAAKGSGGVSPGGVKPLPNIKPEELNAKLDHAMDEIENSGITDPVAIRDHLASRGFSPAQIREYAAANDVTAPAGFGGGPVGLYNIMFRQKAIQEALNKKKRAAVAKKAIGAK